VLSCKRHRHDKDLVCRLSALNSRKVPSILAPQLSYHRIEPLQLKSLTIRGHSDADKTCRVEMSVHNPNKHFFLPGSITSADEQRISGKTMDGTCHREWDCGGKALFPNYPNRISMPCSSAFESQISYVEEDEIMLQGLTAATQSTTHIERNDMTLEASAALEPQNIPKHEFCSSQGCTWANITMPIQAIKFRWQTGSIWCHPDYCEGMGTLVPMSLD
jgi:hypothetical protein